MIGPPLLHEFEMPDLASTVLVPDASWIPNAASSVSTDWGFATQSGGFSEAAVLTRCTETRGGKHHEVTKYEPDDASTREGLAGEFITLTRCTETRSGKHHERPKRHGSTKDKPEQDSLMINGELLLPGTVAFSVVCHARQLISAF